MPCVFVRRGEEEENSRLTVGLECCWQRRFLPPNEPQGKNWSAAAATLSFLLESRKGKKKPEEIFPDFEKKNDECVGVGERKDLRWGSINMCNVYTKRVGE